MHVIGPLVSGINGASKGTVRLYKRNTSQSATWYTDYDASGANSTGDAIDLNADGRIEAYVDEQVQVVVLDSAGVEVVRWDEMPASSTLELRSKSFTGQHYETGASAPKSPVVSSVVMDRWIETNGAVDWKIKVFDEIGSIPSFIEKFIGMFFNVKDPAYGALGNGVADDAPAINAACVAADAGGGIVFFPPGTYRIASRIDVGYKVTLWGCGAGASILTMDHATNGTLGLLGSTSAVRAQEVRGLHFKASQSCTGPVLLVQDTKVVVRDCTFGDGANVAGHLIDYQAATTGVISIQDCSFVLNANKSAIRLADASFDVEVSGCTVSVNSIQSTDLFVLDGAHVRVAGCRFANILATSGTYTCVTSAANDARITDCSFGSSGGATVTSLKTTASSSGDMFMEQGNVFAANVTRYAMAAAVGLFVRLESRAMSGALLQDDSATVSMDTDQFGHLALDKQSGSTVTINAAAMIPLYHTLTMEVWNNGTGGALAVVWGTGIRDAGNVNVANNVVRVFTFHSRLDAAGTAAEWVEAGTTQDVA
jgi:hypothetical protein